jgi:hypothetical protein
MTATERYIEYRGTMDIAPIPPHVLRDYLDEQRGIRLLSPGLHNKTIVITRDSSSANLDLFKMKEIVSTNIALDVRG